MVVVVLMLVVVVVVIGIMEVAVMVGLVVDWLM